MAGIDEIPPRLLPLRLMLLLLIGVDKFLLLNRVSLPEESRSLVVTDADARQQVSYTSRCIGDVERLVNPVADLLGTEEAAGGDLGLESLDLGGSEFARVPPMVEGTEGLQAPGTVGAEPLADLPRVDPEEVGDLVLGPALGDPQDGGEALGDALVVGLVPAAFDLLTDLRFQSQGHSFPRNGTTGGSPLEDDCGRSRDCRTFSFAEAIPAVARPGQEVTLRHDKAGYEVFFPYRGLQRLPDIKVPPAVVEVRMLPKGSKRWWTDEFIDAHAEHERSRSAERLTKDAGGQFDAEASLRELAEYAGFTKDETRRQLTGYINRARKDAGDRHRQANAEFLARNYRLAGELYLKVAEDLEQAGAEHLRLGAYEREAAGDAFYNALDFARSLTTYQDAEKRLGVYRATREALGLGDYPESGPDRRRLAFKAANSRENLGIRVEGPELTAHLTESVSIYKNLLKEQSRSTDPQDWAMTQNNLGIALRDLAARVEGAAGRRALAGGRRRLPARPRRSTPASSCPRTGPRPRTTWASPSRPGGPGGAARGPPSSWRRPSTPTAAALEVRTREQLPQDWAMTQNNLGIALGDLAGGPRAAGRRAPGRRPSTPTAAALEVYTREHAAPGLGHDPEQPGHRPPRPGGRVAGAAGRRALAEAVEAYRGRPRRSTPASMLPQDWAMTQNNLGIALRDLAAPGGGPAGRRALAGGRRRLPRPPSRSTPASTLPQDWAMTQNNLGDALGDLAGRSEGPRAAELWQEAVDAYRLALEVHTREQLPQRLGRDPEQPGQRPPRPRPSGGAAGRRAPGGGRRRLPRAPSRSTPASSCPRTGP